ncbi:MAG: hypothetical protein ACFFDN_19410 [Candidatus Hodarchaeota archaeon]
MYFCYACGKQLNIKGFVDRESICLTCQSYIHCCYNCKFYKPGVPNKCNEPQADFVSDKSKPNFCNYYVLKENESPPFDHDEEVRKVKAKLDALFKK